MTFGSESSRPLHDAAQRYATACDALAAMRCMNVRQGCRWIARACAVCRGWHLEQVRGVA
jgi:hypothetical protein